MAAKVLREYLIKLGWKVDRKDLDKAVELTKDAMLKLTEVSISLSAAVKLVSNQLEALYYSSKRAGSSAKNMKAFESAAEQIGLSADQARSSVEQMARTMRNQPGLTGLLKDLGIKTTGRDRVDVMLDLVTQLKKMPFYQGSAIAQMFGIDDDTFFMMSENLDKLKQANQERRKSLAGMDLDKQAEESRDFNNQLREMNFEFEKLKVLLQKDFLPIAKQLVDWMKIFIGFAQTADKVTSGWSTRIGAVVGGLIALRGVGGIITGLFKGGGLGLGAAGVGAGTIGLAAVSGLATKSILDSIAEWWSAKSKLKEQEELAKNDLNIRKLKELNEKMRKRGGALPIGMRNNNPGNLRSWGNTPIVGGFAKFGSTDEGLSAMAGNLLAYSRRGLNTIEQIISTWAPSNENDTESYIKDVTGRMRVARNSKLNLYDLKTLSSLMSTMIRHEQGYNPFGMDAISAAAATRLGAVYGGQGKQVQFSQKTEIIVNGTSDPMATGMATAKEQSRVNGDLVRNLSGVTR